VIADQIILCDSDIPDQLGLMQVSPIPYLMTFWVWLGTTGPIGWLAPLMIEWWKKGIAK